MSIKIIIKFTTKIKFYLSVSSSSCKKENEFMEIIINVSFLLNSNNLFKFKHFKMLIFYFIKDKIIE